MSLLERVLNRSPLASLSRRRRAADLCVLAYHGVTDTDQFAAHLDELTTTMTPVGLADVEASLDGAPLPEHPVLVTFDDGDRTVVTEAAPALAQRNIPAVCFVVTSLLGTDTPFWWDEVAAYAGDPAAGASLTREFKTLPNDERLRRLDRLREADGQTALTTPQLDAGDIQTLKDSGVAIGNHTHTHPCLDRCTDDEVATEIAASHEALTELTGEQCRWFAYPNGNLDRRAEAALVDRGYRGAFLFDHRFARDAAAHPMRISRLRMNSTTPLDRFRLITSGVHPMLHRARGRG